MRGTASDLPIRFDGVSVSIGQTRILSRVSFEISSGAPTVVVGPNGSGKTTLLKLAMGLICPTEGRISWAGRAASEFKRRAFVFQRPVILRRSAEANVAYAMQSAGQPSESLKIAELFDLTGLAGLGRRPARRLSGGEQQRLALAKALARNPEVLFLDEPTANLDPAATKAFEDIVARISAAGVKVVMATHDLGQARRLAGDIVFLAKGRLLERAPAETFFTSPATPEAKLFTSGELVI
jgi:tungstate transport system ATP-binding protein